MRWMAVALLALTLAGCAAPDTPDPLFGQCPQWVTGPGTHDQVYDGGSGSQVLTPENLTYLGRPFDMVRLKVDSFAANGTIELRAYAQKDGARGPQLNLRDFRTTTPQSVPVLVLDGGAVGHEFEATLTSIAQNDPARPGPLELAWTVPAGASMHIQYRLTFHYKVCGVA